MKCDWCGKEIRNYWEQVNGGGFLTSKTYCSQRCKHEAEASKQPTSSGSSYSSNKSDNSGCLIWTIIKWIVIIFIALVMLYYLGRK